MSLKKDETKPADCIPDVVVDPSSQKRYLKGRFLGKVYTVYPFFDSVKKIVF